MYKHIQIRRYKLLNSINRVNIEQKFHPYLHKFELRNI